AAASTPLAGDLWERQRPGEPKRFGVSEVDYKLIFDRLLERYPPGFFAAQNAIDKPRRSAVEIDAIGPVKCQASGPHECGVRIYRRQTMPRDQRDDLVAQSNGREVARKQNTAVLPISQCRPGMVVVGKAANGHSDGLQRKRSGSFLDRAPVDHCIWVVWVVNEGNAHDRGRNLL